MIMNYVCHSWRKISSLSKLMIFMIFSSWCLREEKKISLWSSRFSPKYFSIRRHRHVMQMESDISSSPEESEKSHFPNDSGNSEWDEFSYLQTIFSCLLKHVLFESTSPFPSADSDSWDAGSLVDPIWKWEKDSGSSLINCISRSAAAGEDD